MARLNQAIRELAILTESKADIGLTFLNESISDKGLTFLLADTYHHGSRAGHACHVIPHIGWTCQRRGIIRHRRRLIAYRNEGRKTGSVYS